LAGPHGGIPRGEHETNSNYKFSNVSNKISATRIGFGHLDFENLELFRISIFEFRIYPFALFSVVDLRLACTFDAVSPPPRPGDLLLLGTLVLPTGLSVAR
jgi:hypothetical protein